MSTSTSRDNIFTKVREATASRQERADYPEYDTATTVATGRMDGESLRAVFEKNLKSVNGRAFSTIGELTGFLREHKHLRGVCDPALMEQVGTPLRDAGLEIETSFERAHFEDYAFGITRATAAIAESGTLVLDDLRTSDRLTALAPWVHIAVLEEREIIPTIAEAVERLGDCPNITWCTGPSKTADVEGILIEGVHGPGEQIALFL